MSSLRYRPEIDGLRALAVIGVVLYHIGLGFPGGYVGVDVFFVISGYLITGIIAKDLRAGTFSMLDFWVRRIRRILPAVTVTVVASLTLGYYILEAEQFKALAESSIAQSLMAANIFFWLDNMSYFAEASDMKPLLHTWSLAVEEQFYVVFPLLLSLLSKHLRKYTLPIIIFIGASSLALSCWALIHKPSANFFLLPTRAWELLAGAFIALLANQKEMSRRAAEVAAWLGLLMIAAAMFFYNAQTPFPGWAAIPPVAGSAIFIWANGSQQTSAGRLLSFKPVVFIGLISYSFYLWHWPILVFTKHVIINISLPWKLGILIISLILSILSWKWVESPFRRKGVLSKRSSAYGFGILSTMGLLLMSATIWKMNGLPHRFHDFLVLQEDISWYGEKYTNENGSGVSIGYLPASEVPEKETSFALWGDSHALMMCVVIDDCAKEQGLSGIAHVNHSRPPVTGIITDRFRDHTEYSESVIQSIIDSGVKNVIIVGRWSVYIEGKNEAELRAGISQFKSGVMLEGDDVEDISAERTSRLLTKHLEMMARYLKDHGVTVWLIKQVPESNDVNTASAFYKAKRHPYTNDFPLRITTTREEHQRRQARANKTIDSVHSGLLNVIDPTQYFFKDSNSLKVYGDRSYYKDDDHLTRAGADYYLSEMFNAIFAEIAEEQKRSLNAN
jgi:peptidoglycan/LPS O-acetylase OafA/YrhL